MAGRQGKVGLPAKGQINRHNNAMVRYKENKTEEKERKCESKHNREKKGNN